MLPSLYLTGVFDSDPDTMVDLGIQKDVIDFKMGQSIHEWIK